MEQRLILITSSSMVPKAFIAKQPTNNLKNPKAAGKQKLSSKSIQRSAIWVHITIATESKLILFYTYCSAARQDKDKIVLLIKTLIGYLHT